MSHKVQMYGGRSTFRLTDCRLGCGIVGGVACQQESKCTADRSTTVVDCCSDLEVRLKPTNRSRRRMSTQICAMSYLPINSSVLQPSTFSSFSSNSSSPSTSVDRAHLAVATRTPYQWPSGSSYCSPRSMVPSFVPRNPTHRCVAGNEDHPLRPPRAGHSSHLPGRPHRP